MHVTVTDANKSLKKMAVCKERDLSKWTQDFRDTVIWTAIPTEDCFYDTNVRAFSGPALQSAIFRPHLRPHLHPHHTCCCTLLHSLTKLNLVALYV